MSLAQLSFKTSYHKGQDDLGKAFYLPCMFRAFQYDRAVGFFRSSIFVIAWPALRDFVQRRGRMRILCSQVLAGDDIDALDRGYGARVDEVLRARLSEEISSLFKDPLLSDPAAILAALVANGVLDLQVAVLRESEQRGSQGRIFHDKLGIFADSQGNAVMFKGSMNETWTGLAADGNLESIDVAATWMGARDLERVRSEQVYFEALWKDRYPGLRVRPFPQLSREEFVAGAATNWESRLEAIQHRTSSVHTTASDRKTLRPHQSAGLADWRASGRRGILAFATGSGKTFTAITAMASTMQELAVIPVVVVPDQTLFRQWLHELQSIETNPRILRAGAGNTRWRQHLRMWTEPGESPRLVLATVQTASSSEFLGQLHGGDHLMLVADEVHRLGSLKHRSILSERLFGPRLGLSATPERAGDDIGTAAILQYFRRILEPRYELGDAIRDGVLTPYFYRPHVVRLSEDEQRQWEDMSLEVRRLQGRMSTEAVPALKDRLQLLLIRRARIAKQARSKVPFAVEIVREEFRDGQSWIVYCDDLNQLRAVMRGLHAVGLASIEYHSSMVGDREASLRWFTDRGGVIVAIKCLDEGVDIPSVSHALIIASSKNPREFVQRRGRVLRRAPGKSLAYIHDLIVVPPEAVQAANSEPRDALTWGELARAVEFSLRADNPAAGSDLKQIAIDAGISWQELKNQGSEDVDD